MVRKRPYKKRALKALRKNKMNIRIPENPNPHRHHHHKQIRRLHSPRLPVYHLFLITFLFLRVFLFIDKLPEWIVSIKLFLQSVSIK